MSPQGSDNNPGTEAQPFQTIQAARDTIRGLDQLPDGGITVLLEDGKYYEQETIVLHHRTAVHRRIRLYIKPETKGKRSLPARYQLQAGEKLKTWRV